MIDKLRQAGFHVSDSAESTTKSSALVITVKALPPKLIFNLPGFPFLVGESKPRPGEVSFETWKYEVLGVSKEGLYSPSLLTPIVRRSVRGQPGEVVRFLGPDSTIEEIISKLEQLYGTVESGAVLLQQVYLSRQESNESASDFGRRLQLLILRACDRGGITKEAQDSTLRMTYWQGLNDEHLKNVTRHKVEQAQDFGEVMCIIRGAEQEIMGSKKFHESRFKQAPKRIQSQSVQENTEKQPKCSEPNDSSNDMNRLMKRLDKLETKEQGTLLKETQLGKWEDKLVQGDNLYVIDVGRKAIL
ncbi:hypothetical protein BSL78_23983 [Apostichopus japonicus]|uniref:Paraneoplastic antigen Ma-like C-terminal domain-containing protein n=1 Tax=Stichopus japonicus TaxID=307972 RepID=A0A2G8JTT4_STIJA|nr:hypothetical protein BSL78_23983 [Apostichopus japonicus]